MRLSRRTEPETVYSDGLEGCDRPIRLRRELFIEHPSRARAQPGTWFSWRTRPARATGPLS
jgi:hypothetical protein